MEENNKLLIVLGVLALILIIVSIFMIAGNNVDEQALSDKITAQVNEKISELDVPTAEQLIALMPAYEVPEWEQPEFDIPEFKGEAMVKDLWKDLYGDEIDELETEAYDVAVLELEDHDYELLVEYLEANIEGFDELEDVDVDDYEVNAIGLGLEEDEDKSAEVVFELEIEYTLIEGVVQDYKKQLTATANVLFEEGDFDEEDVELVFA